MVPISFSDGLYQCAFFLAMWVRVHISANKPDGGLVSKSCSIRTDVVVIKGARIKSADS